MKKKKKKKPRLTIIRVIVLILLFASAGIILLSLPVWRIKEVTVIGNRVISEKDIKNKAVVSLDENVFFVNYREVNRRIRTIPQIKNSWARGQLPSSVIIKVEERKPFAVAVLKDRYLVVDDEGVIIDMMKGSSGGNMSLYGVTDLPTVIGLPKGSILKDERIEPEAMKTVARSFKVLGRTMDKSKFELDLEDSDDISIIINDAMKVKLGEMKDIDKKLDIFSRIIKSGGPGRPAIEYIDVRIPETPAVKFR